MSDRPAGQVNARWRERRKLTIPLEVKDCLSARILVLVLSSSVAGQAVSVSQATLGAAANDQSCAITRPATRFAASVSQVFFRFVVQDALAGQPVTVEWISPGGQVASSIPFESLPTAPALCLVSQLPVGGFAPAEEPGRWAVRVTAEGRVLSSTPFEILADPNNAAFAVRRVTHAGTGGEESELVLEGVGFDTSVIINIARYQAAGGWQYIHYLFPESLQGARMTVRVPKLPAGEYIVILKDARGRLSGPARFMIAASGGYKLPLRPEERWVITQGPYGGFSHWGRSLHAYDLAPVQGNCVVAMRGGTVQAQDLGLGQTPHQRIFGNYVTIAHDDGEYSHYAHLKTGTFAVRTGQRVEAGQALARAGTSGYSFGVHVHVHVTKGAWISSPSVPFKFSDAAYPHSYRGAVQSRNYSALGACGGSAPGTLLSSAAPASQGGGGTAAAVKPTWTGKVAVSDWWHEVIPVKRGARTLSVQLGWSAGDFDLYLVSPSGRRYSVHDGSLVVAGESEERFTMPNPEPGVWRVSVQGVQGTGELMDFWVLRGGS